MVFRIETTVQSYYLLLKCSSFVLWPRTMVLRCSLILHLIDITPKNCRVDRRKFRVVVQGWVYTVAISRSAALVTSDQPSQSPYWIWYSIRQLEVEMKRHNVATVKNVIVLLASKYLRHYIALHCHLTFIYWHYVMVYAYCLGFSGYTKIFSEWVHEIEIKVV